MTNLKENGQEATVSKIEESVASLKSAIAKVAHEKVQEKREFLHGVEDGDDKNVYKAAIRSLQQAEKEYADAQRGIEFPTSIVEIWDSKESTENQETFSKRKEEIILATSIYSMEPSKASVSFGERLLEDPLWEKASLFITSAKPFYEEEVELRDLNNNVIPKGTPNVFVPLYDPKSYWIWQAYHEVNIENKVFDKELDFIPNVRIKEFDSLHEYARYTGVNTVISRGMSGIEKAGISALATQDEFFIKVFEKTKELNANISVVTKYYKEGKTLPMKVWNNATLGQIDADFQYDLTYGDRIIETLQKKEFRPQAIRERYLIDAFTKLRNLKPMGEGKEIGFEDALKTLETLSTTAVEYIQKVEDDKVNEIYSVLLEQYLRNNGKLAA